MGNYIFEMLHFAYCSLLLLLILGANFSAKTDLEFSNSKALYVNSHEQSILSKSIRSVFKQQSKLFNLSSNAINLTPKESLVSTLCRNNTELNQRIGCCMPTDMRYLWNVKILNGGVQIFSKSAENAQKLTPHNLIQQFRLPVMQVKVEFNRIQQCKSYFNGTLHVMALSTVENTFHLFADNIFNHFASILLDAYFYPEMLHLPRKILIYPGFLHCNTGLCSNSVKQIDILYKSFSGGKVKLEEKGKIITDEEDDKV